MARHHGYLLSAEKAIMQYDGSMPLAIFLKQFFAANRQMGSKDRKIVSSLCYGYFRMGKALWNHSLSDKLLLAHFILNEAAPGLQSVIPGEAYPSLLSLARQLYSQPEFYAELFPFTDKLSDSIDALAFSKSMLNQPGLFLRCRPGKDFLAKNCLKQAGISYELLPGEVLKLANATPLPSEFRIDEWAVVQDYSSGRTGEFIAAEMSKHAFPASRIWDACAASGGKSILLHDLLPQHQLTVSDIRKTILHNLEQRFHRAQLKNYAMLVADLQNPVHKVPGAPFDLVLTDVPCTGSGTWSRTPEQLHYFNVDSLPSVSNRQYAIAANALQHLKPGGWLVYITCSVFRIENENVVERLRQNFSLALLTAATIAGYAQQADSMFIAILQKE